MLKSSIYRLLSLIDGQTCFRHLRRQLGQGELDFTDQCINVRRGSGCTGFLACADGPLHVTGQICHSLSNQLRVGGDAAGHHFINLSKATARIADMQPATLFRAGGNREANILAGHLPGIERITRQALRRGGINRGKENGGCKHTGQRALDSHVTKGSDQTAKRRLPGEHLLSNRSELLGTGRQPAFQFRRQRQRRLVAHQISDAQERLQIGRKLGIGHKTLFDAHSAHHAGKSIIERIGQRRLLHVTCHNPCRSTNWCDECYNDSALPIARASNGSRDSCSRICCSA